MHLTSKGTDVAKALSSALTSWSDPKPLGTELCCRQKRQLALEALSPGHGRASLTFCHFFPLPGCFLALPWVAFHR